MENPINTSWLLQLHETALATREQDDCDALLDALRHTENMIELSYSDKPSQIGNSRSIPHSRNQDG